MYFCVYLATDIFSHVSTSDPLTWSSRSQIQAKRAGGEQKLCCACLFSTNCFPVYNVAYTTSHTMSQYNSVLTVPGRGYHSEKLSKCHKKNKRSWCASFELWHWTFWLRTSPWSPAFHSRQSLTIKSGHFEKRTWCLLSSLSRSSLSTSAVQIDRTLLSENCIKSNTWSGAGNQKALPIKGGWPNLTQLWFLLFVGAVAELCDSTLH